MGKFIGDTEFTEVATVSMVGQAITHDCIGFPV